MYIIALGGHTNQIFPSFLPLTILVNSTIQMSDRILVQPILVDTKELIMGGCEAFSAVIALTFQTGDVACIFVGYQQR